MENYYHGFSLLQLALLFVLVSLVAGLVYLIRIKYRPGLRHLPGPFLASITDLDRLWTCSRGHQMNYHLSLHEKHGSLVRIGPNHVSFSDAGLIPTVYNISSKFWKTNFYRQFDIKSPKGQIPTIFSVRDENLHRAIKRPVANAYSMSSLKELEPMNDACSAILTQKFDGLVGRDVDLGTWLHWYAFDVISSITFSNRLGFMERETDVEDIIAAIEGRLLYNSIVGQAPYLHQYLFGNDWVARVANLIPVLNKLNSSRYIVAFAAKQLKRYESNESNTIPIKDMLDRFKKFKDEEQLIDDSEMLSHASSNIFAGADTTAISLRAIFYYLCRNRSIYDKLLAEIDGAAKSGHLSDPVTFSEAQSLPYFQAVVKESLRMHPAVGLLLERFVPSGGVQIGDVFLPEGVVIGANPWVMARDRGVYGDDANQFRPERWLEADEKQLTLMERNFLAFGAGSRTCLGKNISILEISKLVPQILRKFDFELSDPSKEWELHDYWFVKQTGLTCRVKKRKRT